MKEKIVKSLNIKEFKSLAKSAELLKSLLENWGITERKTGKSQEKDKIELVFGNATEIFTHNDDIDYYFFAMPFENNNLIVLYVKIYHPFMNFEEKWNPNKQVQKFIEIDVVRFLKGKDPPILSQ